MIVFSSETYMKEKTFPFCINRYIHDSQNYPPVHTHEFVELVYVVAGEAEHVFTGKHYKLKAKDVFIINPGEDHTFRIPPGRSIEIINCLFLPNLIAPSLLKELGVSQSIDFFYIQPFLDTDDRFHHHLNLVHHDALHVQSILETMLREFESLHQDASTLIRLKMIELLLLLSRVYREEKQRRLEGCGSFGYSEQHLLVLRICGYLERHYDEKIAIPALCELFNISSRHLNRLFKQETGLTVIEMVHKIRIERAKYFLENTNEKVIAIAFKVGYEDPAFFSRLFRRNVGISPGKYRGRIHGMTSL
ncbi:AraC family transcriptional regulator [Pullulanibacillus camelliae]|uniref:AraC family transcriptional regulator n=1 Tax=Pullulanibacillus camelliae TaxID=1707096 RepID=A0A8J2VRD6_9BACL|nr:AraC family transcriptional regulator [Pullulanibacillus camelliae]GGE36938.1 AraC family transcriptional regulator [Pullulanibacillus camelliae]